MISVRQFAKKTILFFRTRKKKINLEKILKRLSDQVKVCEAYEIWWNIKLKDSLYLSDLGYRVIFKVTSKWAWENNTIKNIIW